MCSDEKMVRLELDWTPLKKEDYFHPNEEVKIIDYETGADITEIIKQRTMCLGYTTYSEIHKKRFNELMKRIAECTTMNNLKSIKDEFDSVKDTYSSAKVNFAYELLYQKRNELKNK